MAPALLWGCGERSAPSPAAIAARAANLMPGDAHLAELYRQSCRACHSEPRAKAPLAGDHAAWRARLAKGRPELLRSIVNGLNGMPAGGQCFACTPQDFDALITFMADQ
ncbi:MAG: cytochrome c5 family protein, partial [Proteobacteria bacterium]|nr:cytochrome c5 family protein [Pseudomonadota bacterium]